MKIGFIAGAFDIIHPGYIYMFREAKNNCDFLIVALHTDPTIENPNKLKPILSIRERKEILYNIKGIDLVLVYETEAELITILKSTDPDIRFLGDDYVDKKITGKELSIPIHFIDRNHGWSSTKLKKLIFDEVNNLKK